MIVQSISAAKCGMRVESILHAVHLRTERTPVRVPGTGPGGGEGTRSPKTLWRWAARGLLPRVAPCCRATEFSHALLPRNSRDPPRNSRDPPIPTAVGIHIVGAAMSRPIHPPESQQHMPLIPPGA